MNRGISGKKIAAGEVTDVVFDWDSTPIIPVSQGPTSTKQGNIQGQKIDLYHLKQNEQHVSRGKSAPICSAPAKTPSRSITTASAPKAAKRQSEDKKVNHRGKDIARPIHHLPGSTVPHMRVGSDRTRQAASWLAGEQSEVGNNKKDSNVISYYIYVFNNTKKHKIILYGILSSYCIV